MALYTASNFFEDDDDYYQREYDDASASAFFASSVPAKTTTTTTTTTKAPSSTTTTVFGGDLDTSETSHSAHTSDLTDEERYYGISPSAWYHDPPKRAFNPYWDDDHIVFQRTLSVAPSIDTESLMRRSGVSVTIAGPAVGGAGAPASSYTRIGGGPESRKANTSSQNTSHLSASMKFENSYRGKRNHQY